VDSYKPKVRYIKIGRQGFRTAQWEGDPKVRPLLFFNGIGANLELVVSLARRLNRSRDVITFDPPGIGGSPDAQFPYRIGSLAKSAARILDELGYTTVDVYGVSWGGGLAQQFAFQYAKRVRCLVLAATSAGMLAVPGHISALSKMMNPARYTDPNYLHKNFETLYGKISEEKMMKHSMRINPPTSRGYAFQLMAMAGWTSAWFLPFLSQPTLILAGDEDKIVPLANAQILKTLIRNSRLQVIKGAGHLFFVSRADEKVPMIRNFLRQHKVRRNEVKLKLN
jgi:poly(3-hydroxyalkanoate) depolymerase